MFVQEGDDLAGIPVNAFPSHHRLFSAGCWVQGIQMSGATESSCIFPCHSSQSLGSMGPWRCWRRVVSGKGNQDAFQAGFPASGKGRRQVPWGRAYRGRQVFSLATCSSHRAGIGVSPLGPGLEQGHEQSLECKTLGGRVWMPRGWILFSLIFLYFSFLLSFHPPFFTFSLP